MSKKALYFLTGASASGKTALLKGVVESAYPNLQACDFDGIGVPPVEEMNARFGGPSEWQAIAVRKWMEKIRRADFESLVVLEGQARPSFILDAARETGISALHVALVDCSREERRKRLRENRARPDLDTPDMHAWAAYLRGQADALNLEILDTTGRSVEESVRDLARSIERFANLGNVAIESDRRIG